MMDDVGLEMDFKGLSFAAIIVTYLIKQG